MTAHPLNLRISITISSRIFGEKMPENAPEFVFFNGEKCYSDHGEQEYLNSGD